MSPDPVPWAGLAPRSAAEALGSLRLSPGVRVAREEGALWLRGEALTEELELELRRVPGIRLFHVLEDKRLRRPGERVPSASLPEGGWLELDEWLRPTAAAASYGGLPPAPVPLELMSGGAIRPASVLVCELALWSRYATRAPEVRLRPLTFAVSDAGLATVRGEPLPPIAGRRFACDQQIATPLGTTWSPPVGASVLVRLFELEPNDLVLLHEDGTADLIEAESWVAATRASVRASAEELPGA